MTSQDYQSQSSGLDEIALSASEAQAALITLEATARDSAASIEAAFSKAGESLAKSLSRAASDGKISLGELAAAVIAAINSAGSTSTGGGLNAALSQALSTASTSYGGARAAGGAVANNRAYVVGENGPEVFVPNTSGQIQSSSSSSITVNMNLNGTQDSLVRSEAQLATAIRRAVRMGGGA